MFKYITGIVVIPFKSRTEVPEIWCITFWLSIIHKNCTVMEGVMFVCVTFEMEVTAVISEESAMCEPHKIVFTFFFLVWIIQFMNE